MQRLGVEMELHRAVERSEFVVRYQPLLNVAKEEMTAVEALVRWQHPTRGELLPASFLGRPSGRPNDQLEPVLHWPTQRRTQHVFHSISQHCASCSASAANPPTASS